MLGKITFMQLFTFIFLKTKGRLGRLSFVFSNIFILILSALGAAFFLVFSDLGLFQVLLIYYILLFYPLFCLIIKRFQDFNVSPKIIVFLYLLLPAIYVYGPNIIAIYAALFIHIMVFLLLCLIKGSKKENKYGENIKRIVIFEDINFELFKYIVISTTITLATFFIYKDLIYDKHIKPQVKLVMQNKAVFMQLNALSEWSKVVKTKKFQDLTIQEQDAARLSFARYVNNKIKKMNIYTEEQLEKDFDKLLALMQDVEQKHAHRLAKQQEQEKKK